MAIPNGFGTGVGILASTDSTVTFHIFGLAVSTILSTAFFSRLSNASLAALRSTAACRTDSAIFSRKEASPLLCLRIAISRQETFESEGTVISKSLKGVGGWLLTNEN